jgi:cell wall-associated NlpC family hydrolase
MMTPEQRQAVVEEAKTWLRTRYHHHADVKGHGVDCAMILSRVYSNAGIVPFIDPRPYPTDWMMHRDEERYLQQMLPYAEEVFTAPQPGDILLFRYGRTFSHSAIVIDFPLVIHAHAQERMVVWGDVTKSPLKDRPYRVFTPIGVSK